MSYSGSGTVRFFGNESYTVRVLLVDPQNWSSTKGPSESSQVGLSAAALHQPALDGLGVRALSLQHGFGSWGGFRILTEFACCWGGMLSECCTHNLPVAL